jgi:hypothetical protein
MDEKLLVWFRAFGPLVETLIQIPEPASEHTEQSLNVERQYCQQALTAIATSIANFDKPQAKRFYELALAFESLNRGQPVPLFNSAKVYDRPQEIPQRWMARARAVLAIEALVRADKRTPSVAAKSIATRNPNLREFAGAKARATPLHRVLLNWRKEFQRKHWRAGRPKREVLEEGRTLYEEGIKKIDKFLAEGRHNEVLAIADNLSNDIKIGSVFSTPVAHR